MTHRFALALVLVVLTAGSALAQTPAASSDQPVIVTTGEGTVKRAPDRVWVMIAAESRARVPQEAQRANADAMSAVMAKLKGAGLAGDAIRTVAYDLQPEFDYANNRQTLRGYVARNTIEVRVDEIEKAGQILEMAVGSGATSVSGVRFDLKDRTGAEREAVRLAVTDARGRAEAAASGAGLRIERIVRIEERRMSAPEPRPMMMAMRQDSAMASGQPPMSAGELEIRASVTLTAAVR